MIDKMSPVNPANLVNPVSPTNLLETLHVGVPR